METTVNADRPIWLDEMSAKMRRAFGMMEPPRAFGLPMASLRQGTNAIDREYGRVVGLVPHIEFCRQVEEMAYTTPLDRAACARIVADNILTGDADSRNFLGISFAPSGGTGYAHTPTAIHEGPTGHYEVNPTDFLTAGLPPSPAHTPNPQPEHICPTYNRPCVCADYGDLTELMQDCYDRAKGREYGDAAATEDEDRLTELLEWREEAKSAVYAWQQDLRQNRQEIRDLRSKIAAEAAAEPCPLSGTCNRVPEYPGGYDACLPDCEQHVAEASGDVPYDERIAKAAANAGIGYDEMAARIAKAEAAEDSETAISANGGLQSKLATRYDLVDGAAMDVLAGVLAYGATKYAPDNWRLIELEAHVNHAVQHLMNYIDQRAGRVQVPELSAKDDDLGHAFCRMMMAVAMREAERRNG